MRTGRPTWFAATVIAVAASMISVLSTSVVAQGAEQPRPTYDAQTVAILSRLIELDRKVTDVKVKVLYTQGYLKGLNQFVAGKMYRLAVRGWRASQAACDISMTWFYLEAGSHYPQGCLPFDAPPDTKLFTEP